MISCRQGLTLLFGRGAGLRQLSRTMSSAIHNKQHLVIALGGNALLKRGDPLTVENQRKNIADGVSSLLPILKENTVTIVHGNGPQVGLLALQGAAFQKESGVVPMRLDVLDAETEGMIGYLIEQEVDAQIGRGRGMVTVLSQIIVDQADPAFHNPTKFIGPVYTEEEAKKVDGVVKRDGDYFRKVVPSPLPIRLIDQQMAALRLLTDNDCIVVCAGGGGIPVIENNKSGRLEGVEAVIDKDHAAAMLGINLNANGLMILTDVNAVATDYNTPEIKWIKSVSPEQLETMMKYFPPGSMGPKVEAAINFVKKSKGWCTIGSLKEADKMISKKAGTLITNEYGPNHVKYF